MSYINHAEFTITCTKEINQTGSIRYRTVDGSALSSSGAYQAVDWSVLNFASSERQKTIAIRLADDLVQFTGQVFYVEIDPISPGLPGDKVIAEFVF